MNPFTQDTTLLYLAIICTSAAAVVGWTYIKEKWCRDD